MQGGGQPGGLEKAVWTSPLPQLCWSTDRVHLLAKEIADAPTFSPVRRKWPSPVGPCGSLAVAMETTAARECSAQTRQLWWAPADYAAADNDAEGQDPLRGALESGKTVLANVLTESSDITEYSPTQGVRFESCWPALMKDAHGVVIVFSADIPSHRKEMEMWYSCFVQQQLLQDTQCMLIAHHKPGSGDDKGSRSLSVLQVKFLDQQQSALSRKCESSGPTQICGSRNSWSRAQQSVG
ncbi:uncharacterized protein [Macaca nemestrina]|uniref:uncharacterized protein isoform X2 n=1 Tax=Macaca nemestrina TaxID=9545 RepID=UPI0039B8AD4E